MSMAMLPSRRHFGALAAFLFIAALAPRAGAVPSTVSYQGQLAVDGAPFTGDASFKFALLCGSSSAWSNDGSSANGSEPATAVVLPVAGGLFSVLLGDAGLGMIPLVGDLIDICASPTLRVWVDAGAGFEQLSDQPLASSPFALISEAAAKSFGSFTVQGGGLTVTGGNTIKVLNAGGGTMTYIDGADGTVGCEVLQFGDGTSMTTAAVGGADSDWIVNGNNMSSGVSGNVGVGTASPGTKLHIVGDARVDGSNGNGIDTRNPNATTAILRLGWMNDIARIRVGGSGLGSNGGLDIQGTSDASLLRILNNGDATISGNLTVLGTITGGGGGAGGFLAIPPSAFLEADGNLMDVHRSSVLLHGRTAAQGLTLEAPVHLPHGATITQLRVYLTDSDATRNIQTFLLRDPLVVGGTPEIVASLSTIGTPGATVLTSAALSHVVDNENNSYVVACNWTTPNTVTACAVNGMRVSYTAP
jgi:hypothetical protein